GALAMTRHRDVATVEPSRTHHAVDPRTEPRQEPEIEDEPAAGLAIAQAHERAAEALALAGAREPTEERLPDHRVGPALDELAERLVGERDDAGAIEQHCRDRHDLDDLAEQPRRPERIDRRLRRDDGVHHVTRPGPADADAP